MWGECDEEGVGWADSEKRVVIGCMGSVGGVTRQRGRKDGSGVGRLGCSVHLASIYMVPFFT